MTRFDELLRGTGACVLLLGCATAAGLVDDAAAQVAQEDDHLFRVERIEISAFGSWLGGATYLDLPAPLTELTFDTGANDILDFSGEVPRPEGPNSSVIAPHKEIEPGWQAGLATTFYLTPNFGISLSGSYGRADAAFTGEVLEVIEEPDPSDPNATIDVEVLHPRSEIDRATVTTWAGEAGIIYHILAERKHSTRPFVTLGIGGILNQFADTDDVSALTWNVGLGVGFPIVSSFRGFVEAGLRFYVWETDEVDLDETLVFPELSAGIVWRHMVPELQPAGAIPHDQPAPGSTPAQGSPTS